MAKVEDVASSLNLHVVLTGVENGWTMAQVRELPAVVTAAPTEAEARELIVDALREYLASFTEPDPEVSRDDLQLTVTIGAA